MNYLYKILYPCNECQHSKDCNYTVKPTFVCLYFQLSLSLSSPFKFFFSAFLQDFFFIHISNSFLDKFYSHNYILDQFTLSMCIFKTVKELTEKSDLLYMNDMHRLEGEPVLKDVYKDETLKMVI